MLTQRSTYSSYACMCVMLPMYVTAAFLIYSLVEVIL